MSASPARQYRLSPKSRRAPPPPSCPPPALPTAPPVPPPPPSRSPMQIHEYLDNTSSFSYYTSPISTLNLDSSFTFSTLSSDQSRYHRTTDNYTRNNKVRKRKAPSPPTKKPPDNVITEVKSNLLMSVFQKRAWQLFPIPARSSHQDPEPDSADGRYLDDNLDTVTSVTEVAETDSANLTLYVASPLTGEREDGDMTPASRPPTPRVRTPRQRRLAPRSPCDTDTSINYSIFSLTRPPSFLFKFRKTVEVSMMVN